MTWNGPCHLVCNRVGGPTEYFAKTYERTGNTVNGLAFFTKCLAFEQLHLALFDLVSITY